VITGEDRYAYGQTYSNFCVVDFESGGRRSIVTEWYVRRPAETNAGEPAPMNSRESQSC
jgi:hypothetical protein